MNDYGEVISKYFLTGIMPAFRAGFSPLRFLLTANESVLQDIVELILDERSDRASQLRLVVDGSKEPGDGRFGFVDIFIQRSAIPTASGYTCVVMELKNI